MKIINWNIGRPTASKYSQILDKLYELDGDIVVITETNSSVVPPKLYNVISTNLLPPNFDGVIYKKGENRTTVWTKFPIVKSYPTYDAYTSICTNLETPDGILTLYASIIGILGGKGQRFQDDLQGQLADFDSIFPNKNVCFAGDYNVTFKGYIYPSYSARQILNNTFQKFTLTNVTAAIPDCVDHISMSTEFIKNKKVTVDMWNLSKTLSDHIGTSVTLREIEEAFV